MFTDLKGFSDLGENLLDDQLRANLISFFDWGLLNKGNFYNVYIPSSGQYGGDKSKLQHVKDERYSAGQVWQGFRNNWVWESGLSTSVQPIRISGVYVNNTFYSSSTSGAFSHYIDYPRGRVIFNSPIATTSTVKAEYSYKYVNVCDANDVTFLKELQTGSFRLDSPMFSSAYSGNFAISPDKKIQTPLMAVEVTSASTFRPYQLGGGQYCTTKIILHVLTDNSKSATKLAMIASMQSAGGFVMFDVNEVSRLNRAPLTYLGSIASGALTHPQMVQNFEWKKLFIENMTSQEGTWLDTVYHVPVSFKAEVILNDI